MSDDEGTGLSQDCFAHLVDSPEGFRRLDGGTVLFQDGAGSAPFPILEDVPTTSGIKDAKGQPIRWPRIRRLTLQGLSTPVYGCAHCDYVRLAPLHIRSHLKRHAYMNRKAKPAQPSAVTSGMSLAEALSKLGHIDAMRDRELKWRERALAAERELAKMKRLFKSLGE